jgi:diguanylate cyclase (GGDEF)-like protein
MLIDENVAVNVGVSLGIVSYAQAGQSFESLSQAADQAMYEVKRHGKNGYCVYAEDAMVPTLLH